jgi:ketol-acid reductoisomerase
MKIYRDQDASLDPIRDKKVGILGYGSQGHAHALNLRDSGIDVRVGLRADSASRSKAVGAGLRVVDTATAAAEADIVMMLVPDEQGGEIYGTQVAPGLRAGKYLAFGHGFNIHFKKIVPPADVSVFMVAPKGPGHLVRSEYGQGRGFRLRSSNVSRPAPEKKKRSGSRRANKVVRNLRRRRVMDARFFSSLTTYIFRQPV